MTHTRAHDHVPPGSPAPPLLTVAEAARELRCSKGHVHNIIHGKVPDVPPLPILRIGRRVLIRHEGLKAWMLSVEENMARKLTVLHRSKSLL
jgi:excisionase family DNA binding protein